MITTEGEIANNTYVMVIARSLDVLLCSWVWRDYDITISSMCGLALRARVKAKPYAHWQAWLGTVLNRIQTGHCESAITADTQRASLALNVLMEYQLEEVLK